MAASRPAATRRCRQLLAELVEPVAPIEAVTLADRLIDEFGSLPGVLAANRWALARIAGPRVVRHLGSIRRAQIHSLRADLDQRLPLDGRGAVMRYLCAQLAHRRVEHVRILYLDHAARLIRDELAAEGCVDRCAISTRQIVARALELHASGLIVAHNHPSGDPQPSAGDMEFTRSLATAARHFDIALHDHLIVTASGHSSLRAAGAIPDA